MTTSRTMKGSPEETLTSEIQAHLVRNTGKLLSSQTRKKAEAGLPSLIETARAYVCEILALAGVLLSEDHFTFRDKYRSILSLIDVVWKQWVDENGEELDRTLLESQNS